MSRDQQSFAAGGKASVWNPLALDAYADYLALLSANNPVVTIENVLSQDGELLLAEGMQLDQKNIKSLKDKILARPLANSIQIETLISADDLLQHLLNTIRSTEYFQSLAERKHPLSSLEPVCAMLANFPLVQQFLTVMAAQMNDLYQRTLCVSLWSLYIAQEMRLPVEDAHSVFWAAITHDIGMLHLRPDVLNKSDELTADEWAHVQSHVEISTRILSDIPGLTAHVIIAVSEHHERCDGTGYPLAKVESELSILGQILAVADAIVGIYFNRFKAQGRRWREVIPVLEMNRAAYLYRSCDIVTTMILRSELPLPNLVSGSSVPEFAERMLQQNLHLQNWFIHLRDCLTSVGYTHGDRQLHALQNVVLHIATTFKGSMLFKEDLRESLESMANERGVEMSQIVADASLIQQEMSFHLQRLSRMMQMYIAAGGGKDPKIAKRLQDGFSKISGLIK
ncbi:MAG: HD domain-containing phosphohydrolase [Cellvibrio sp.]|uniref:HD-GYP domain-containing protein n=1 Tax=Cellvibrio sp. TaxID=1965322 RepID=UPI0031A96415